MRGIEHKIFVIPGPAVQMNNADDEFYEQVFESRAEIDEFTAKLQRAADEAFGDGETKMTFTVGPDNITYDGPPLKLSSNMQADGDLYRPSYCCQRCGNCIGWVGCLIDAVIGCRWRGCKAPLNP